MKILITALLAVFISSNAMAKVEKCTITSKFVCNPEECRKVDTSKWEVWVLLDFGKEEYSRCDIKGCDTYPMIADPGGMYINIIGSGFKSKVRVDRKEFMEYVSLMLDSYVSYGYCE